MTRTITLTDNRGRRLAVPADATLGDMVRAGMIAVRLAKPGEPLPDGWWAARDNAQLPQAVANERHKIVPKL